MDNHWETMDCDIHHYHEHDYLRSAPAFIPADGHNNTHYNEFPNQNVRATTSCHPRRIVITPLLHYVFPSVARVQRMQYRTQNIALQPHLPLNCCYKKKDTTHLDCHWHCMWKTVNIRSHFANTFTTLSTLYRLTMNSIDGDSDCQEHPLRRTSPYNCRLKYRSW